MSTQTNNTTAPVTLPALKYSTRRVDSEGNTVQIDISLADECKNGHPDFHITGTVWAKGKPKTDKYILRAGSIGDYLAKEWPEFQLFEDLHGNDFTGAPCGTIANGWYYIREGKLSTAKSHFMATDEQMNVLALAESKEHLHYLIMRMGLPAVWQTKANEAVAYLENVTGYKFKAQYTRTHYTDLTTEQYNAIAENVASGFYDADKVAQRKADKEQADLNARYDKLVAEYTAALDKSRKEAQNRYQVACALLECGIMSDNYIIYNHNGTVNFNWMDYRDYIEDVQIEAFRAKGICNAFTSQPFKTTNEGKGKHKGN